MSDIRLVSYKNTSIEDALKEARKISSETKGNEAIVDLGDGNLAIVNIDETDEEIENISANNDVTFEDKIKGKLQEKLNTSAEFNPKVMEFSVQENSFFGLFKSGDKIVNYSKNNEVIDNKISDSEIKVKNEFLTLKEAENAAKDRTGLEAVVYDEKKQKFYLVKVSQENLNKYTELDKDGKRVFKSDENLDSKILDIEKNKGKKIVSFVIPDKMLGIINVDNVVRRNNIEKLENLNLNTQKDEKLNIDINSLETKIQNSSEIDTSNVKSQKILAFLNTVNELRDSSFIQNAKKFIENSDSLFLNTSASNEEKIEIRTQLENGFKDLEKVFLKLSENPSNEELEKFIKENPDMMKNIMSVKYASEFSKSNVNGNIGNILLEKNRIEKQLKFDGKGTDIKEIYSRLSKSSNLSNPEKLWLASVNNEFLSKKVESLDIKNKTKMQNEVVKDIDKLKSIDSKLSELDVNNVLDDIVQNGINESNIEQLKEFVNKAKTADLSKEDEKVVNNISNDIKRFEKSKLEADLSIKKALEVNQTFINKLNELQRTLDPNDEISQGLINYLMNMQIQYNQILTEIPPNSTKMAIFSAYMNKVSDVIDKIKSGNATIDDLIKVEQDAKKMFAEYDRALQAGSLQEAKTIMINAYRNFSNNENEIKNFENLVNLTRSLDNVYNRIHNNNSNNSLFQQQLNRNRSNSLSLGNFSTNFLNQPTGTNNFGIDNNSSLTNLLNQSARTNSFGLSISSTNFLNQPIGTNNFGIDNNSSLTNLLNQSARTNSFGLSISSTNLLNQPIGTNNYELSYTGLLSSSNSTGTNSLLGNNYLALTFSNTFSSVNFSNSFSLMSNNNRIGFNSEFNSEFNSGFNSDFNSLSNSRVGFGDYSTTSLSYLSGIKSLKGFSNNILLNTLSNMIKVVELPSIKHSASLLSEATEKNINLALNTSATKNSYLQKELLYNASDAEKALAANLAYSEVLNEEIKKTEERAEIIETQVQELYENFDSSVANIADLLQTFREIIVDSENDISDIKRDIKKKLFVQMQNINAITDNSKRRKLLDRFKEIDNETFKNSREVQLAMKSYLEKFQAYSLELKKEDAKKVLEEYNKLLKTYNSYVQ
ncbi:MAG: hypothetical protein KatS3mg068_2233 [Candidatus Sericytochromatia bacterium]|nr:MAG: hypothetical protein KatS3mg068_2233 [Candidatus Sericytochromatia bacterium]